MAPDSPEEHTHDHLDGVDDLRARAEAALDLPADARSDDASRALHELQVHQIELEMQNDELRRAQAQLIAAEARYHDLYNQAPVGYVTLALDGSIQGANDTACRMLQTPASELLGRKLAPFISPDDQDCYYLFRRGLGSGETEADCEVRLITSADRPRWVHLVAAVHEVGGERLLRVTIADIDSRKQAERRLAASEQRLRMLIANSSDVIFTMDASGVVTWVADTWSEHHHRPVSEFVNRPLAAFMPPEDAAAWHDNLATMISTMQDRGRVEFRIPHFDSTTTWHEANLMVQYGDEDGELTIIANARDISATKQHEQELRSLAMTDLLTGIGNRRRFLESSRSAFEEARRYGHDLSVLMIDVDNLKRTNDERGHADGDYVLQQVAGACSQVSRDSDVVGRLGGDEFAIILSHANLDEAVVVATRLLALIAELESALGDTASVSIGIGVLSASDVSIDEVVRRSDHNLYLAKRAGRGQFHTGTHA